MSARSIPSKICCTIPPLQTQDQSLTVHLSADPRCEALKVTCMAVKFETGNLLGAIYALLVDIVVYARKAPSQEPATTGKGRKTLAARNPASQETARHGTEFNKEKALTARALDRKESVTFVQFNRLSVCVGCKPTANALRRQTQGSQFCTTHVCSRQLDATVLKDHLGALPHTTCPESVVSASGTAAAAAESALADLIHAVPQLLEVMLPDTLAALLAANTVHRKQVHDFVTCITVTDLYVNALIAGSWPRLTKWKLSPVQSASEAVDRLIMEPFGLDAATTALFIKGELQELQGLNVFGRPCKQIIPEIVKANWPHLQSLSLSDAGMDVSDMQNLLAGTWPQLKILDLSGNALTHESILQLVCGDWPQLETLSLKGNQIGFLAAKELVKGAWPLLKRLYLSQNNLDQSAMQMLLTGKWPLLDCLSIRSNPVCCSIIADEQAVIGEGTTRNHTSSIHMSALFNLFRGDCEAATTAWPELKMLYW